MGENIPMWSGVKQFTNHATFWMFLELVSQKHQAISVSLLVTRASDSRLHELHSNCIEGSRILAGEIGQCITHHSPLFVRFFNMAFIIPSNQNIVNDLKKLFELGLPNG